ncbi:MAG: nuclear transport factor 2 family protein [Pirellulaceae bacterium]|nr:nuclear transport factor 2 family protein [Pirellulaceae bacterium]MDG2470391.1 nuclear transport factor 2 family protein [Pirellulaceae bacterium]
MKVLSAVLVFSFIHGIGSAQDNQEQKDAKEIKAMILKMNKELKQDGKLQESNISSKGAHEFWSSGGFLVEIAPDFEFGFDSFNLTSKHITIISLIPGKAAVAAYYNEGSFKPKNNAKVEHYRCRVTTVFVNENGKWKERHSHYSPVKGGSGTTQTTPND